MEYVYVKDKPLSPADAKAYVDHFYGPHWKPIPFVGVVFDLGYWQPGWPHQDHAALVAFMVKANVQAL